MIEKYPFLRVKGWPGDDLPEGNWFEQIPDGWRIAFGEQMVEEISNILKKANFENDYNIVQIKEKWGGLRWYDTGAPSEIYDELQECIAKYESLSQKICIECGAPAVGQSNGWIMPFCQKCADERIIKISPFEE